MTGYGTLTRKRTTTDIMVEVEVDISDLAENGWHHEDDCPSAQPARRASTLAVADALASLHRQAHPGQASDPLTCHEEPCRSLSYDEIRPQP
jgi:hypothetical protein